MVAHVQVQTLFVLLGALMVLQRKQTTEAQELVAELGGPKITTVADELWFNESVAVMVITPVVIAALLALYETAAPAWQHWRTCVAMNPAFPPSMADFFLRGRIACVVCTHRPTMRHQAGLERIFACLSVADVVSQVGPRRCLAMCV